MTKVDTAVELVIEARRRDLGGFEVGRVLPWTKRRMVGPFVFFDHMGPVQLAANLPRRVDVRPHPHIGLSTITYLFAGEIVHRDSLGFHQVIRPGEVNWMTAGRGISHSERFETMREHGGLLHGIQAWIALPEADEEIAPAFVHLRRRRAADRARRRSEHARHRGQGVRADRVRCARIRRSSTFTSSCKRVRAQPFPTATASALLSSRRAPCASGEQSYEAGTDDRLRARQCSRESSRRRLRP